MIRKGVTVEQAQEARRKLGESYRRCFRSPAGTIVLDDLKEVYLEGSCFVGSDPHATAYNVGMQDVVRNIVALVEEAEQNEIDLDMGEL